MVRAHPTVPRPPPPLIRKMSGTAAAAHLLAAGPLRFTRSPIFMKSRAETIT